MSGGTVSQSTISIMTHRPDRAVPLQIHRVINTRGDPHHFAQRVARFIQNLHRVGSIRGGTVTHLAKMISPAAKTVPSPFK